MYDTRNNANGKAKISEDTKSKIVFPRISYIIQGCVFEIRKQYGPGHKEVVYHRLLIEKFNIKELKVEHEKRINIYSQDTGKVVGRYQPDLVVEDKVILEIKSSRVTIKNDEI